MAVADVMHVVAVEIHVAAAGRILDPDALGLGDGVEAGRRHRLAQEIALVLGEQRRASRVERSRLPGARGGREVGVALGLGDGLARSIVRCSHLAVIPGLVPGIQSSASAARMTHPGNPRNKSRAGKRRDDIYRLRQACSLPNTSRSSTRCSSFAASAVSTISVAMPRRRPSRRPRPCARSRSRRAWWTAP